MRDAKRINAILEKLRVLWELNPDLRFGQVYAWLAASASGDPFFWEEDKWEEVIHDRIIESIVPKG